MRGHRRLLRTFRSDAPRARCEKCRHWRTPHVTSYTPQYGIFPLCERCWSKLDIPDRVGWYRRLWEAWLADAKAEDDTGRQLDLHVRWPLILAAVRAGR